MTRAQAVKRVAERLQGRTPDKFPAYTDADKIVEALDVLGLVKFEEPAPAPMIDCNCTCADKCPQGKIGSRERCYVPAAKATLEGRPVTKIEEPPKKVDPRDVIASVLVLRDGVMRPLNERDAFHVEDALNQAGFQIVPKDAR